VIVAEITSFASLPLSATGIKGEPEKELGIFLTHTP
jgi:hypothetical protein